MSLQVKPGYVNPLTTMNAQKSTQGNNRTGIWQGEEDSKVSELQTKQQQLQNEILLLKTSGSDTSGMSVEKQKMLKQQLEEINAQLTTAKAEAPARNEAASKAPNSDHYEKEALSSPSPGIYQLKNDEDGGYQISFSPYSQ